MKLVVTGASGYVATEVIRQSLNIPKITSVIAIARRAVAAPSNPDSTADVSKLQSVVVSDYGSYPEDVMKQLAGADACIWYSPLFPFGSFLALRPSIAFLKARRLSNVVQSSLDSYKGLWRSHRDRRKGWNSMKSVACAMITPSPDLKLYSRHIARVIVMVASLCVSWYVFSARV